MDCCTDVCISGLAGDQGTRRVVVQTCVLAGWPVTKELGGSSRKQ